MRWLRETVTDSNGKTSSKRVAFMVALLVSSLSVIVKTFDGSLDGDIFNYYCLAFAAVGAVGVLEKKHDSPS